MQIEETKRVVRGFAITPARLAAAFLLAKLFVVSTYRAATQSISHDEAVIFEWLLSGPWGQVLNSVHGNHHVVTDLLSKLMITLFRQFGFRAAGPRSLARCSTSTRYLRFSRSCSATASSSFSPWRCYPSTRSFWTTSMRPRLWAGLGLLLLCAAPSAALIR